MNILVIFTGGTIGSTVSDGYIATDKNKAYKLLSLYENSNDKTVNFSTYEPYTILSENLTGATLHMLGDAVKKKLLENYDGIIITHGSDTLQYSAAALDLMLPQISIPIMLVASNYVLEDPRNNGLANFAAAVAFIKSKAGQGVFVPYRNSDSIMYIHHGAKTLPHRPYNDDLFSINNQYYGTMENMGLFIPNIDISPKGNPQPPLGISHDTPTLNMPSSIDSHILRIYPFPGMQYPDLANYTTKGSAPKSILLDTYHSGTLCSDNPNMEDFFQQAKEINVPIFITGASEGISYASVKDWETLAITTLPAASPIAMYVKLWMAIETLGTQNQTALIETMLTPVSNEF